MDDEDIRLRDKFAIEILQSLLASNLSGVANFVTFHNSTDNPDTRKVNFEKMEHTVRAAYKIADIMRKVRLTSFE